MFKTQTMKPLHGLLSPSKQKKEEIAREHGWEQWYHDDNWIRTEWLKKGMKVEYSGVSLDHVYMNIMQSQEDVSIDDGFERYDPLLSNNITKIGINSLRTLMEVSNVSKDNTDKL
jgi:hypothetical protein